MPVTDLLDRISIPTRSPSQAGGDGHDALPGGPAPVHFQVEIPTVERVGIDLPPAPVAEGDADPAAEAPSATPDLSPSIASPARTTEAAAPPLPSWAIIVIGALSILCLALTVALLAGDPAPATAGATEAVALDEPDAQDDAPAAVLPPSSFPAEPSSIPVDLITRLEEAGEQPLDVELSRLLDAVQHGFGRRSAQLEPTLRTYVYRMASRFEWNPDTFRVAVTAPDPDLAAARGALLERLFSDAVAAGRLDVGVGVGPHALALLPE